MASYWCVMWTSACLHFRQPRHVKSIFICNHASCTFSIFVTGKVDRFCATKTMKRWHQVSVLCVSAHLQLEVTSMADMNVTQLPDHVMDRLLTSPNSSSSSWQEEVVRGVQITTTLLIFLVRDPPEPPCDMNIPYKAEKHLQRGCIMVYNNSWEHLLVVGFWGHKHNLV